MVKQKIIKLEDSRGKVAFYEDSWNWFPDKKGINRYKEELEGHKFKEVYIGVKKSGENSIPFNKDLLYQVFLEIKPSTYKITLAAYVKDQSGTFVFDKYFQESWDVTWERAQEAERKKLTNKYKPLGVAVRGTSLVFKTIGTIISFIIASNAIYWWLW